MHASSHSRIHQMFKTLRCAPRARPPGTHGNWIISYYPVGRQHQRCPLAGAGDARHTRGGDWAAGRCACGRGRKRANSEQARGRAADSSSRALATVRVHWSRQLSVPPCFKREETRGRVLTSPRAERLPSSTRRAPGTRAGENSELAWTVGPSASASQTATASRLLVPVVLPARP